MSRRVPKDLAASVRARLLKLSRERNEAFDYVLTRYATERLLYRLSRSPFANRFVLKGAALFNIWCGEPHRPTRDLDFLAYGDSSQGTLHSIFRDICTLKVEPDGLRFAPDSIRIEEIREPQEYPGWRIGVDAYLGKARIPIQVDVAFGDVVIPKPQESEYPTLIPFPAPRLRTYPKETMIAEKLETMVALGMVNSRMKDFFDVWFLAHNFEFEGEMLVEAIAATFEQRRTEIPSKAPLALTDEFAEDSDKAAQWRAFLQRTGLSIKQGRGLQEAVPQELKGLITDLREFLLLPLRAAATGQEFRRVWPPRGPWGGPTRQKLLH